MPEARLERTRRNYQELGRMYLEKEDPRTLRAIIRDLLKTVRELTMK